MGELTYPSLVPQSDPTGLGRSRQPETPRHAPIPAQQGHRGFHDRLGPFQGRYQSPNHRLDWPSEALGDFTSRASTFRKESARSIQLMDGTSQNGQ